MYNMAKPVQKNEYVKAKVIDYNHEGQGVIKIDKYPIFIPNAMIGEEVEVKVIKATSKYGIGKLSHIDTPCDARVDPPCIYYAQCGGCQLQHMSYDEQMKFKKNKVINAMKRIGKLDIHVNDVVRAENPFHYRNKTKLPVQIIEGATELGFYRNRSHDVIPIEECLIQRNELNQLMRHIRKLLNDFHIKVYDERTNSGHLKHVIIRTNISGDEVMIGFVTVIERWMNAEDEQVFIQQITDQFPNVKSIQLNINPHETNVILGKESIVLYGEPSIKDQLFTETYELYLPSFYQVNPEQTERLYQTAINQTNFSKDDVVIDAYCGIGTIGQSIANRVKEVIGIEVVEEAVENAKDNAKLNGIDNATYYSGKVEDIIHQLIQNGEKPSTVIVDPPRKGCDQSFLQCLMDIGVEQITYISCNPSTLARDLKLLSSHYDIGDVTPVDMFSQTYHVETVVVMSRVDE